MDVKLLDDRRPGRLKLADDEGSQIVERQGEDKDVRAAMLDDSGAGRIYARPGARFAFAFDDHGKTGRARRDEMTPGE